MIIHSYIVPAGQSGYGDVYDYHVDPFFDSSSSILVGYCFTTVRNHGIKISEKIISKTLIDQLPEMIVKALTLLAEEKIAAEKKKMRFLP